MSKTKRWVRAITIDAVMFGLLYAWLFMGLEGAGNVFMVAFWFLVPLVLLVVMVGNEKFWSDIPARPAGYTTYHVLTDLLMIAVLAWFGHILMAVARMLSLMMFEGGYRKEMERRTKA